MQSKSLDYRRSLQSDRGRWQIQRGYFLATTGILFTAALALTKHFILVPDALFSIAIIITMSVAVYGVVTLGAMTRRLSAHASTTFNSTRRLNGAISRVEAESRLKSEFLAGMSHELRTPLNAIMGFSEIISLEVLGPEGNPKYREYAEDIFNSATYLLSMVNDILDLSKVEADKMTLEEESVCLHKAAESVLRLIRDKANKSRLKLTVSGLDTLPNIFADERRVKQVLLNLLSNAIKFTTEGGTISVTGTTGESGCIIIQVTDTGIGMNDEQLSRVLLPFEQVYSKMNCNNDSTGLGLPLVSALMKLHSGNLELQSSPGVGTKAIITFPQSRVIRQDESLRDEANILPLSATLLLQKSLCEALAQSNIQGHIQEHTIQ